jgi:hypothetical protein
MVIIVIILSIESRIINLNKLVDNVENYLLMLIVLKKKKKNVFFYDIVNIKFCIDFSIYTIDVKDYTTLVA